MKNTILILDLDGVLITTPSWKSDEIDSDGYSKFNEKCVENLNKLLALSQFEIWLSSTRRTMKTLDEFNLIFANRNIKEKIQGFLPEYKACKNRREEIELFIEEFCVSNFLIIDDDKSLNGLSFSNKKKLISTKLQKGFNEEKFMEVIEMIKKQDLDI